MTIKRSVSYALLLLDAPRLRLLSRPPRLPLLLTLDQSRLLVPLFPPTLLALVIRLKLAVMEKRLIRGRGRGSGRTSYGGCLKRSEGDWQALPEANMRSRT